MLIGVNIPGFLPSNSTTKYFLEETKHQKDITINLVSKKGKPVLYAYYCENSYLDTCFFDKVKVKKGKYSWVNSIKTPHIAKYRNELIQANNTLQHSSISISNSNNLCHKKNNELSASYSNYPDPCNVIAIVNCEGPVECEYSITFVGQFSHKLLKERVPEQESLDYQGFAYFKISVSDPEVEEVEIIINAVVGYLEVKYSLEEKFPVFFKENGMFIN